MGTTIIGIVFFLMTYVLLKRLTERRKPKEKQDWLRPVSFQDSFNLYLVLVFLATFIDISDYAILYLKPLWLVGTSGKNNQIPIMGDLSKTAAVGI